MNKKLIIGLLAVILIFALAACGKKVEETVATEAATTEAVIETSEETVPGVIDSVFDDDFEATQATEAATEETQAATTVPTAAAKEDDGIHEPDGPGDNKGSGGKGTKPKNPTKQTEPTEETEPEATTEPTQPQKELTEYEKFQNMSPEDQQAFMESFADMQAFFSWLEKARADYEAANPTVPVTGGNVDLKDYE